MSEKCMPACMYMGRAACLCVYVTIHLCQCMHACMHGCMYVCVSLSLFDWLFVCAWSFVAFVEGFMCVYVGAAWRFLSSNLLRSALDQLPPPPTFRGMVTRVSISTKTDCQLHATGRRVV